ncbi:hypothetical protein CDL15_Pgr000309 [Punica granatum]|uniref:Terpene synthase metal-binding domain-containing protein n=1 Tax=Punica granatum TaxID=22663 RepID=A0A218Y246_PUNGR|nr:hypothetical protein CDL15_Pgr000309 [Punica granatum]
MTLCTAYNSYCTYLLLALAWMNMCRWWSDLGLANELKFARDQLLKWYFWPMAVLRDPKFSQERMDMTKPITMVYIIDDIFDVRGTLDELTLFAEAITRWECVEELPDYMKTCFRALDGITNEICLKAYKKHGGNPTDLLRKSWANLCDAFLVEKRWFTSRHSPSADEYLNIAIVSTGVHLAMAHSFALLCGGTNKQSLQALNTFTGMSASIAKILRLWDDLGSAKLRAAPVEQNSALLFLCSLCCFAACSSSAAAVYTLLLLQSAAAFIPQLIC